MKLFAIILLQYLTLWNARGFIQAEVKFDLPESSGAYVGQLRKGANKVDLDPPLKAFLKYPDGSYDISSNSQICGFHTIFESGSPLPFDVDLVDKFQGIGEIRVKADSQATVLKQGQYVFQIEAYDCGDPRQTSERVFVQIAIQREEELSFTQVRYEFSVGTYTAVGSVVGKVTVLHESANRDAYASMQCGYDIQTNALTYFSIDALGVLRTHQVLNAASPSMFEFRVFYRECNSNRPKTATATVKVDVIQNYCEAKWKGLPRRVEHTLPADQPERLLWPPNFKLDTCGATCKVGELSLIAAELRLRSAGPDEFSLLVANSSFCRHDPRSLQKQRKLCDIHPATLLNLLPNPTKNLLTQINSPSVGTLPQVVPVSMALRFIASAGSGWRVDNQLLMRAAQARRRQTIHESYPQRELLISNIFEQDFTLSFWLQRQAMPSEEHETIICSQEDTVTMGRALWIGFKGCTIIVQMTTRDPQSNQENRLAFRIYNFPELSDNICPRKHLMDEPWHHYSISVLLDPATSELTSSTLMVDGIVVGSLMQLKEPPIFNRPSSQYYSQYITVGTAYDPRMETAQQSLNGALAGFMLLLGQNEDQSSSRCIAECGETLLLPRASSYISGDATLLLNVDSITVTSKNMSEIINILSNVVYVKPDDMSTALQFDTSSDSSNRLLELHTIYTCNAETLLNIPIERIDLNVQPNVRLEPVMVYPRVETVPLSDASVWVPKAEMDEVVVSPRISILGQSIIRAEIPTLEPGIPMFPELSFTLVNTKLNARAAQRAASVLSLDQCLVIPLNGGSLNTSLGERVNFPIGRIHELGITVDPSNRGILLKGHQIAGQYASLLHGFRYLPPTEVDKLYSDPSLSSRILWTQQFELICSSGKIPVNTDDFIVKIILTLPIIDNDPNEMQNNFNGIYKNVDNRNDLTDYDADYAYDDEDDDYPFDDDDSYGSINGNNNQIMGQWPPINDKGQVGVDFAKSDKDIRPVESLSLKEKGDNIQPQFNAVGLSVTLAVCALIVAALLIAFLTRNTSVVRRYRAKCFPKSNGRPNGSTSGRLEFRTDSDLNVIENPIDWLEGGSSNSNQKSRRLPGVHGPFAGNKEAAGKSNLQSAADDQFDAETRSFDGLFEDELEEGGSYPEGSAALEEVDDFDESETIMASHANGIHHEEVEQQDDDEDPSDDCEETFSVGPSHLEFVTLPTNNRQHRDSHQHLANV